MSLHCDVIPLWALGERTKATIAESLCWPGSDFHGKLTGGRELNVTDGTISIVRTDDRILGWARSEPWVDANGWLWPTLEAFVEPAQRRAGIAAFATAGLFSSVFAEEGYGCAVFWPPMLLVAARAGLHPALFERSGIEWKRSDG
jgi:hypothetical protein